MMNVVLCYGNQELQLCEASLMGYLLKPNRDVKLVSRLIVQLASPYAVQTEAPISRPTSASSCHSQ